MSPYESILGLSGLWIQHVERHKDIQVWARPSQRLACILCQHKNVRIKATHRHGDGGALVNGVELETARQNY